MSWAEIKKAINSDFLNEPLDTKINNAILEITEENKTLSMITAIIIVNTFTTVKQVVSGSGKFSCSISQIATATSVDNVNVRITVDGVILLNDRTVIGSNNQGAGTFVLTDIRYNTSFHIEVRLTGPVSTALATVIDKAD